MTAIVLIYADEPEEVAILPDDFGENRLFESFNDADMWLQKHARVGWCTRIIELDD